MFRAAEGSLLVFLLLLFYDVLNKFAIKIDGLLHFYIEIINNLNRLCGLQFLLLSAIKK